MIRKSRSILAATLLVLADASLHVALAGDTLTRIERTGKIVLGGRESSLPFSYVASSPHPIGYTMDICARLVDATKRYLRRDDIKVEYKIATPSTRFSYLIDGTVDIDCGPNTNTAERRQLVAFTIANFIATARMLVPADSGIQNWSDLRGRTIVTTKGTTNARTLSERNDVRGLNIALIEADDDYKSFTFVENGTAHAFAMDDVLLFGLKANSKTPNRYKIVGAPLSVEPYAIMFSKQDIELKKILDSEMAKMIHSGEIAALYTKWFNSPIPPRGINLMMPMNPLLRSSFQFPSDKVGDEISERSTKN